MCRDKTHVKGVWCYFSIEHILRIYSQCAAVPSIYFQTTASQTAPTNCLTLGAKSFLKK